MVDDWSSPKPTIPSEACDGEGCAGENADGLGEPDTVGKQKGCEMVSTDGGAKSEGEKASRGARVLWADVEDDENDGI